jgi:hypothetical protein
MNCLNSTDCLHCAQMDVRQYPQHARVGFCRCRAETLPGVFENFRIARVCTRAVPADSATVARRLTWEKTL